MPRASHACTHAPAISWASRNGTPWRTSHSATSVASEKPCGRELGHPLGVEAQRRDHAGRSRAAAAERVDRVEDRLLVLLQVAVVRQRQALERGEQPGEVADQPAGLAARELGDVGVLLLRHDRRPGRVGVVAARRSRTRASPRSRPPRRGGRGPRRPSPRRTRTPPTKSRDGGPVDGVRDRTVEASSAATAAGSSPSEEPASAPEPYGDTRRPPVPVDAAARRRAAAASACASRWWASSTGWACCRWVRPGIGASGCAAACSASASTSVQHQPATTLAPASRRYIREQRRDLVVARPAGAEPAAERRPRPLDAGRARARCARPRRPRSARTRPAATSSPRRRAPPSIVRELVVVEQARPRAAPGRAPSTRQVVLGQPPVEVRADRQRGQRVGRPAGEPAAPQADRVGSGNGALYGRHRRPSRHVEVRSSVAEPRSRLRRRSSRHAADLDEALGLRLVEGSPVS